MKKYRSLFKKITKKYSPFYRKYWKRIVVLSVLLLVILAVYRVVSSPPKDIETTQVVRSIFIEDFSANGSIKAESSVDLKFYSPGKVVWIGVKEGQKISKWQGVASLDTVALNANYQQALNNYRNYQAIAEKVLDEVKDNDDDESFDLKAQRTTAEVNRDNAYDAVLAAKDNLDNALVVSPIAGTVVDINGLLAGINLSASDIERKIIRVVDLDSLYFEAQLDEVDFSKVRLDQEVIISVDSYPDLFCDGSVYYIGKDGNISEGGVVTIPVKVSLKDCDVKFISGLNGQASFVLSKKADVLLVPQKFIVKKDGEDYIWRQSGDSIKNRELVKIEVGSVSSTQAEVVNGLNQEDIIIYIP